VKRSSVSKLAPVQAPAVRRAIDERAVEATKQSQLLNNVGVAEKPAHAGARERFDAPTEQVRAVGHRHRIGTRRGGPTGRVIGGNDHDLVINPPGHRTTRTVA